MGTIGVIPIPPATNRYDDASTGLNRFRSGRQARIRPTRALEWISSDPHLPSASRIAATRWLDSRPGSPHKEYWRTQPDGSTRPT